jgi:hypothetical protein
MWYQVFLGRGDAATPTTPPLQELDLLLEIKSLARQGVTWENMHIVAFRHTARELAEARGKGVMAG